MGEAQRGSEIFLRGASAALSKAGHSGLGQVTLESMR